MISFVLSDVLAGIFTVNRRDLGCDRQALNRGNVAFQRGKFQLVFQPEILDGDSAIFPPKLDTFKASREPQAPW